VSFIVLIRTEYTLQNTQHATHRRKRQTNTCFAAQTAGAEFALMREEFVAMKTATYTSGRFALDQASGRYSVRVSRSSYSSAYRDVIVGPGSNLYSTNRHST